MDGFLGRCPSPRGEALLIAFLCVIVREPETPDCAWLQDRLSKLAERGAVVPLEKCGLVRTDDVQTWVSRMSELDEQGAGVEWLPASFAVEAFKDVGADDGLRFSAAYDRLAGAIVEARQRIEVDDGFFPA